AVLASHLMHLTTPLRFAPLPSFYFNVPATTAIYTLSLHDALPISRGGRSKLPDCAARAGWRIASSPTCLIWTATSALSSSGQSRSEEHTSELQSPDHLVCRLLLEKKKHTR